VLASVIIVNYNGCRFLADCLRSVGDQELGEPFEVILVDNASTDGSVDFVKQEFPDVRLVLADKNLGFAGGNNLGMRAARGRHIVLLNNDTQVRAGWLQALVTAAEQNPAAGAIAAKLLFVDPPNTIQNAGSLLLSDGSGADRGFREPDRSQYDTAEEVFGACGASVLYRRQMLEDVGLFDETFFMYYEDTDLNWRMRLRGWSVLYEPTAVVDHVHAGSSREWSPFFTYHVDRNRLFMLLKNASLPMVMRSLSAFVRLALDHATGRGGRAGFREGRTRRDGGRARVYPRVVGSLLLHLPEMLIKRSRIRRRRTVSDAAIERWFVPREQWAAR
jgi:GT2 family glycosyltransferase